MIAALLCGRADDTRFPSRNIFPLFGRPLMTYAALAALHAQEVDHVFMSSDDEGMRRIADHHGVRSLARPADLSGPDVPLQKVVLDGYEQIRAALGAAPDALVVLLANAPTVASEQIDQGVRMLRADAALDAVVSASRHDEFHPSYALSLSDGRLRPHASAAAERSTGEPVYFPDALLWVIRSSALASLADDRSGWMVDVARGRVAPLLHEGYGDVDHPWQIPIVEDWLRRHGFDEASTPYERTPTTRVEVHEPAVRPAPGAAGRRVLITTVPFGVERTPLDMLEADRIEYVINPIGRRLREEELVELARDFGVIIAGTEPITAKVMDAAPHLRLISRVGIGLDSVDLAAARSRGIAVSYTPEAPSPAVAELAVGLMLSLLRGIPATDRVMRNGVWRRTMGRRLSTMTVGVIGVGRIGKRVIKHLAGGFPGVRILANDLERDEGFGARYGVEWAEKDDIYQLADVVTLHLPLSAHTQRLIGARELALMKPTAIVVNTSRGNMVDEAALAAALREGKIAGAAIDVFNHEPYSGELSTLERCVLTCHMGSMSEDCRAKMELEATAEALRFLRGEPLKSAVPDAEYACL